MVYFADLPYACSLNELSAAEMRRRREGVVRPLGGDSLRRIYRYADVLHREVIGRVADERASMGGVPIVGYGDAASCRYDVSCHPP